MTRTYYAISWEPYGVASNPDGSPCGTVLGFETMAERDAWVTEGAAYRHESGFRESILRSAITAEQAREALQATQELKMAEAQHAAWEDGVISQALRDAETIRQKGQV